MRGWTVPRFGEPRDVLELTELPEPVAGDGRRVVRVEAASVNFADILYCRGTYQEKPPLPFTPGLEVAGTDVLTGERVFGPAVVPHGGYAEQAVVGTSYPWPDGMTPAQASGFFVAYQTGWCALHHRTSLRSGETLLVHAAAGGVGAAAVQLGLAAGARVIATVGSADKAAVARRLGAHEVIVLDGPVADVLVPAVKELTDGRGADVVYDPVGGDTFDASRRVTAWEGRLLVIGFAGGRIADAPTNHALVKNYDVVGVHWAAYRQRAPELVEAWQRELEALWARRLIDPLVGAEYALADLPDALDAIAARTTTGRVVVTP
ncbi:NADPH:quinone oxidoreductase family protein [Actinomycetospora sp. TBRC 11914]|uniref:NADPH:quinone oxidoreductase family protein n=1 Tax=Actinomycetospora sp. TBRC 11914 TaxID=2729387 RepID=UPI00145E3846|nr:NADPH:quinone oxidoreductase family protein [Actinomycetospora sp. TBRC 11914]NMO92815.1 NADPH:quinone oxidoreductase family protein [Actinomycetospora sp. TBRC 11914]